MTNEELDCARVEEAWNIYNREHSGDVSAIAARLAREGWTPPEPVDPDIAEAEKVWEEWGHRGGIYLSLMAIKRGRALAAAEAKPGLVWVKHDGSNHCPIDPDSYVWIKRHAPLFGQTAILMAGAVGWPNITHYAVITPPAEDVA